MGLFASRTQRQQVKAEGRLLFSVLSFARANAHEMPTEVLDQVLKNDPRPTGDDVGSVVKSIIAAPEARRWRPVLQPGEQWIAWHYSLGSEPGHRFGGTWLLAATSPGRHRGCQFLDEELAQLDEQGLSAWGTVGRLAERVAVPISHGLIKNGDGAGFRNDYLAHVRAGHDSAAARGYADYLELGGKALN